MMCKRKSIIRLSQFILVVIFIHLLVSCGSADEPLQGIDVNNEPIEDLTAGGSVEDVVAALQKEGVTVTAVPNPQGFSIFNDLFEEVVSEPWDLDVDGELVQVYLFKDVAAAREAASSINRSGDTFTRTDEDGNSVVINIDYITGFPPRFWRQGTSIIYYFGQDSATLNLLDAAFGQRIADGGLPGQPYEPEQGMAGLTLAGITFLFDPYLVATVELEPFPTEENSTQLRLMMKNLNLHESAFNPMIVVSREPLPLEAFVPDISVVQERQEMTFQSGTGQSWLMQADNGELIYAAAGQSDDEQFHVVLLYPIRPSGNVYDPELRLLDDLFASIQFDSTLDQQLTAVSPTLTPTSQPTATIILPTSRTVSGRLVTSDAAHQPIPAIRLQLEPGGAFVTETIADGRFTLTHLPFEEITVYADYFQFTIDSGDEPYLDLGDIRYPSLNPPLTLSNYPPSEKPYHFEDGSFWLVHTPEGQIFTFSPLSPDYADSIEVAACQFIWVEANKRFTDPCSGDEWELNGRLNQEQSSEMWSNRALDRYPITVQDGMIFVQFDQLIQSLPINEPPLAADAQYGVTVTAVTTQFNPTSTSIDTLVQVDPIWGMDAVAFPPQQAFIDPTFSDSLFDDQGRAVPPMGRHGGRAVFDSQTRGVQQMMFISWDAVPADAQVVTATLTVNLDSLHREVVLPLDWDSHQVGDSWAVDMPIEIGYAAARVQQVEWVEVMADGRSHLRLTVIDDSPAEISLSCLHLALTDSWQRSCANFNGEQTYTIFTPSNEPVVLQLRASLDFIKPFQLTVDVVR